MRRSLRIAVVMVSAALALPALAGATARSTYVLMGDFDAAPGSWHLQLSHPSRFRVGSADSSVTFSGLRWTGWGGASASATGQATTCDDTGCLTGDVTLTATRRRACGQQDYYRHMTASRIPEYGDGPLALPVGRPDCSVPAGCAVRFGPSPQDVAQITVRVRASCATARRVVGGFMSRGGGDRKAHRSAGWTCRWLPPGGPRPHCTRGSGRRIEFVTD